MMRAARRLGVGAAIATIGALPATASDLGVGFVVSPEQAYAHAFAPNPDDAFSMARSECRDQGGEECLRVAWCYPAGWSGWLGVMLTEFHYSHPMCGAQSRDGLIAMMRAFCETGDYIQECYVGVIYDPDGNEETPDLTIVPEEVTVPDDAESEGKE